MESEINITVNYNDSGKLCCEMVILGSPYCVQLELQLQAGWRIDTTISFHDSYSGNQTWNLAVNCTVIVNVKTGRDDAFFVPTVDGITSNRHDNTRYSTDWSETRHGVHFWIRRTFFHVGITGRSPVTVGCLLLPSGHYEYGQTATRLFEPRLTTPAVLTTRLFEKQQHTSTVPTMPAYTNPSLSPTPQANDDDDVIRHATTAAVVVILLIILTVIASLLKAKVKKCDAERKAAEGKSACLVITNRHYTANVRLLMTRMCQG